MTTKTITAEDIINTTKPNSKGHFFPLLATKTSKSGREIEVHADLFIWPNKAKWIVSHRNTGTDIAGGTFDLVGSNKGVAAAAAECAEWLASHGYHK